MGLPVEWFVQSPIDEEYMCPVCMEVMENPTMIESCEHIFCQHCIQECKSTLGKCPLDRESIGALRPPHRTFVNAYNRLQLKCKFAEFGCAHKGNATKIKGHHTVCEYSNPDLLKSCTKNCGAEIKMRNMPAHDCIIYLKAQLAAKSMECDLMKDEIAELYTKVLALESMKATRASKQDTMLQEVLRLEEALAKLKVEIVMQKDADSGGGAFGEPIVEFPDEESFEGINFDSMARPPVFFTDQLQELSPSGASKIRARRRLIKPAASAPSIPTPFIGAAAAAGPVPGMQMQMPPGVGTGASPFMPVSPPSTGTGLGGIPMPSWSFLNQ